MPPPEIKPPPLDAPISTLWGVGTERAKLLARLDIHTIEDLLLHKPRRYEDRRKFVAIRDLKVKETATVRGKIVAGGVEGWEKGPGAVVGWGVGGGGGVVHCRWGGGQ